MTTPFGGVFTTLTKNESYEIMSTPLDPRTQRKAEYRQRPEENASGDGVFPHMSSELAFYGVSNPEYISEAVENALRTLMHMHADSQHHFRSVFLGSAAGTEHIWELSETAWRLLIVNAAHRSPELSAILIRNLRYFRP